jgi:hypothetical protein
MMVKICIVPGTGFLYNLEEIIKQLKKDRKNFCMDSLKQGKGMPNKGETEKYLKDKFSEYMTQKGYHKKI